MDDLLADDMMKGLSLERAVNYAVEFIRVVGMPRAFEEKVEEIKIENYRGVLPCDFYEEVQVKDCHGPEYLSMESPFASTAPWTYKIQGNVIITSIKETTIKLAYRAHKVDADGFPMILDNGSFASARRSDNGDALSRSGFEREVRDDRFVFLVTEFDMIKCDPAFDRVWIEDYFRYFI